MNWAALAPVPMTATRLPASSTSSRQRAEWNDGPANESRPSMSGKLGRLSCPTALSDGVVALLDHLAGVLVGTGGEGADHPLLGVVVPRRREDLGGEPDVRAQPEDSSAHERK